MEQYIYMEFSKLYKRILEVETRLKDRLMFALNATYPNKNISHVGNLFFCLLYV